MVTAKLSKYCMGVSRTLLTSIFQDWLGLDIFEKLCEAQARAHPEPAEVDEPLSGFR